MAMELFESEANCFLHQFGAALIASLSHPAIYFVNESFWQAYGGCGCSLVHSRGDLRKRSLPFQFFEAPANRVFHKLVCARVAVAPRNSLDFFVQILWDRRCLPTCLSFGHVLTYT
jgi:hypothetical protein